MTPKFHRLTIKDIRKETEDAVSIAFDMPEQLVSEYTYLPGQYLTLKTEISGEEVRRSYSLCSAPIEKEWRVAIKRVENGLFSSHANTNLKVGDALDVMTPMGNFALSTDVSHAYSYALFAAGSGITPILSILKSVLANEPASDVTLFYGNKNFHSIIFREEIEALKNKYMERLRVIHVLSQENLGNTIQKGRIDGEKTQRLFDAFLKGFDLEGVYICGPEEMILGVRSSLMEKGISEKAIHFELFNTSRGSKKAEKNQKTENTISSNVAIILDGDMYDLALQSDGESILDAANRTGADLPFACKGGVCCTCKAKIIEGTASMDVNYALEKDEVDAGYILTCQAHPTSEKLIISFDE